MRWSSHWEASLASPSTPYPTPPPPPPPLPRPVPAFSPARLALALLVLGPFQVEFIKFKEQPDLLDSLAPC